MNWVPLLSKLGSFRTAGRQWLDSALNNGQRLAANGANWTGRKSEPAISEIERQRTISNCLFCQLHDSKLNHLADQNSTCFARYDNFPATPGHIEIVPKRHVESFFELRREELADAYQLIQQVRRKLDLSVSPDGYTIGINEGRAAGRSIDHLHIHVIPRHVGDVEDARGGIRQVVPNWEPSKWESAAQ